MPEITLMSDPRVAAVPVRECGEPLTDVRRAPRLLVDGRAADPVGAYAQLRQGLLERLLAAQSALPPGLRLLFIEGYRPPELQRHYFARHSARLRAAHPAWSDGGVRAAARRYVSPPEVAPDSAGAGVHP